MARDDGSLNLMLMSTRHQQWLGHSAKFVLPVFPLRSIILSYFLSCSAAGAGLEHDFGISPKFVCTPIPPEADPSCHSPPSVPHGLSSNSHSNDHNDGSHRGIMSDEAKTTILHLRESLVQQKETILDQRETIRELTAKLTLCEGFGGHHSISHHDTHHESHHDIHHNNHNNHHDDHHGHHGSHHGNGHGSSHGRHHGSNHGSHHGPSSLHHGPSTHHDSDHHYSHGSHSSDLHHQKVSSSIKHSSFSPDQTGKILQTLKERLENLQARNSSSSYSSSLRELLQRKISALEDQLNSYNRDEHENGHHSSHHEHHHDGHHNNNHSRNHSDGHNHNHHYDHHGGGHHDDHHVTDHHKDHYSSHHGNHHSNHDYNHHTSHHNPYNSHHYDHHYDRHLGQHHGPNHNNHHSIHHDDGIVHHSDHHDAHHGDTHHNSHHEYQHGHHDKIHEDHHIDHHDNHHGNDHQPQHLPQTSKETSSGGTGHSKLETVLSHLPHSSDRNYKKLKSPSAFLLDFPIRTNYMYAKMKQSVVNEIFALTICLWLKPGEGPGLGTPISYAVPGQANELVLMEWGSNPMELLINDKAMTLPINIMDGKWHHVCVTWSTHDGAWEAYQDGVKKGSGQNLSAWRPIKPGGNFILGQEQDTMGGRFDITQSFMGQMSDFQFWSRVLTASEIHTQASCGGHLVGDVMSWSEEVMEVYGGLTELPFEPCH
ncbi:neuronal pentraxin-1 isoform X2 [Nothobranchius furzeri]|uniref:neuronal pentraxin-1 isoform X2 n=1 Tax=Nothobranchius furzeri TaxID=105023 RepID=UPI002403B579|nr:uncharacterized protein LOC107394390 isoform X2 [Nothobranchius furzeri]